jgi:protein involved in polysaccharide export with SLBB domain
MRRPVLVVLCLLLGSTSLLPAQGGDRPLLDGDRVLIKLWMDSLFADSARVQQGAIMLPRLGPMSITGIPAERLADSVRRAYSAVFRPVTAEITALRRVTVLGEVRFPRVYYFEPGTRVREAIATAGGIPESGKSGHITVLRDSVRTRLRDWQLRTDDVTIVQSGDVLVVDRESWFKRNAFTVVSGTSVLLSIIITLTQQ